MNTTLNGFPALSYKEFNIVESGSKKFPYNVYYVHWADSCIFGSWVDVCQTVDECVKNIDSGDYKQYMNMVDKLADEGKEIPFYINNIYTKLALVTERYKNTQDKQDLMLMESCNTIIDHMDADDRMFMEIEDIATRFPEHFVTKNNEVQ